MAVSGTIQHYRDRAHSMRPDVPYAANPIRGLSRYRVIVRRLGREPRPYGWEIHDDETSLPVRRSENLHRLPNDAWEAGRKALQRAKDRKGAGQTDRIT